MDRPVLSEEHLDEIKRVFAMCDVDGDHKLDRNEIRTLLTNLGDGIPPSEEEISLLINKMDKNKDMLVSYEEFEAGVAVWLAESAAADSTGPILPGSPPPELADEEEARPGASPVRFGRRTVHAEISHFLLQFRPHQGIHLHDLAEEGENLGADTQLSSSPSYYGPRLSAAAKVARLEHCRAGLAQFPGLAACVRSAEAGPCAEGVRALASLLRLVEDLSSAEQRYLAAPVLVPLWEAAAAAGLPARLAHLVADAAAPAPLRALAARCIALYAPGPRMAHTPPESPWHPAQFLAKRAVVEGGAAPALAAALAQGGGEGGSGEEEGARSPRLPAATAEGVPAVADEEEGLSLRAQSAEALTAIAETNPEGLQLLLGLGLRETTLDLLRSLPSDQAVAKKQLFQVRPSLDLQEARAVVRLLSVLLGHTHEGDAAGLGQLSWEQTVPILETLSALLNHAEDPRVLAHACCGLARLLPLVRAGGTLGAALAARLAGLLRPLLPDEEGGGGGGGGAGAAAVGEGGGLSPEAARAAAGVLACLRACFRPPAPAAGSPRPRRSAEGAEEEELTPATLAKLRGLLGLLLEEEEEGGGNGGAVASGAPSVARDLKTAALLTLAKAVRCGRPELALEGRPPLVARLLALAQADEVLAGRAVALLRALAAHAPAHPRWLLRHATVAALFQAARRLRSHDEVLEEIYHFTGPSFNIRTVQNAIACLTDLLQTEMVFRERGEQHIDLLQDYGMNGLSCIQDLINVMLQEVADGRFVAWLVEGRHHHGALRLDEEIERLLGAMRSAHTALQMAHLFSSHDFDMKSCLLHRVTLANVTQPLLKATESSMRVVGEIDRLIGKTKERLCSLLADTGVDSPHPFFKTNAFLSPAFKKLSSEDEPGLPSLHLSLSKEMSTLKTTDSPLPSPPGGPVPPIMEPPVLMKDESKVVLPAAALELSKDLSTLPDASNGPLQNQTTGAQLLTLTGLNFEWKTKLTVSRNVGHEALARHAAVLSGRDVDLLYQAGTVLEPICSQEALAAAWVASLPLADGSLPLFLEARLTEESVAALRPPPPHFASTWPAPLSDLPPGQPPHPAATAAKVVEPPPPPGRAGRAASLRGRSGTGLSENQKRLAMFTEQYNQKYGLDLTSLEFGRAIRIFKKLGMKALHREAFRQALAFEGVCDPGAADQAFEAFDTDRDGQITLREFLVGLSLLRRGTLEDRLRAAFAAFDADGNGVIDAGEMAALVAATLGVPLEAAQPRAEKVLLSCAPSGAGVLDFVEFQRAVLHDPGLLSSFWLDPLRIPGQS